MSPEFVTICEDAARRLADAQRATPYPSEVYVWAVFTNADRDGWIHIGPDRPDGLKLAQYEIVRPRGFSGWSMVPFSNQRAQLLSALSHVPILPLERVGTPAPANPFAAAALANANGANLAAIDRHARERQARRDSQPMAAGGLFDEVRRATVDLFSPET